MKRIIVCMDGTWQTLNQDQLTNIGIIARSIAHKETRADGSHVHQIVIYTQGVGSSLGALARRGLLGNLSARLNRFAGGAFGEGLEDGILDTYLRLAFNYETGDEIFIFGFSRGAFAARRLAGLINTAGIVSRRFIPMARDAFRLYYDKPRDDAPEAVKREHEAAASQFRTLYGKGDRNPDGTRRRTDDVPPIKYLGVFDTVVQRGAGEVLLSFTHLGDKQRYAFKNLRVCPNVEAARHAVAVDEGRASFPPMLWVGLDESNARVGRKLYEQRWFIGAHGDVGGGGSSSLPAAALKWIADGAVQQGLRFYATHGEDRSPLDDAMIAAGVGWDGAITRPSFWKSFMPINYPGRARTIWERKELPSLDDARGVLDETVVRRASADYVRPRYRPQALRRFRKVMQQWRDELS